MRAHSMQGACRSLMWYRGHALRSRCEGAGVPPRRHWRCVRVSVRACVRVRGIERVMSVSKIEERRREEEPEKILSPKCPSPKRTSLSVSPSHPVTESLFSLAGTRFVSRLCRLVRGKKSAVKSTHYQRAAQNLKEYLVRTRSPLPTLPRAQFSNRGGYVCVCVPSYTKQDSFPFGVEARGSRLEARGAFAFTGKYLRSIHA